MQADDEPLDASPWNMLLVALGRQGDPERRGSIPYV